MSEQSAATRDFQESRDAEAQNRPPVYIGQ